MEEAKEIKHRIEIGGYGTEEGMEEESIVTWSGCCPSAGPLHRPLIKQSAQKSFWKFLCPPTLSSLIVCFLYKSIMVSPIYFSTLFLHGINCSGRK